MIRPELAARLRPWAETLSALAATGFDEAEIAEMTRVEPKGDPEKTPDVVTSQSQVDDLLASLGF